MGSRTVQEQQEEDRAAMSFAPMIDVVFQLLIFFLVCSKIKQTEDMVRVYLAQEGNQPRPPIPFPPDPVYVLVRDDEGGRGAATPLAKYSRGATYYINSTDGHAYADLNQLREALNGLTHTVETPLIIYPADESQRQDQKTPWKNVLGVVDAGIAAGYRKIQFRPPRQYW